MSEAQDTTNNPIAPQPTKRPFPGGHEDAIRNPAMTVAEKRQVLARWASDAHAVENLPAMRQLDDGSVVNVDEILAALKALDGSEDRGAAERPTWRAHDRRRGRLLSRLRVRRRSRNGDDDPPPPPAVAAFPIRFVSADAVAA